MSETHRATTIVPCRDLKVSEAFYGRLGLKVVSDYGHYLILADGKGWHLHLTAADWPGRVEDNPFGLYLYAEDVDALADRLRGLILAPGAPERKPWGTYEFAISDPDGALIRIGRAVE
ncbi:VOC family protein [Brevundimonas sp.]|jgi:catechol 2,3-dioxygenase-like lactoylglutathione lyase family enzyme|uniref:VOC family protein n=1 Tax=Brevundimonas sp. TaxID=1871086 RepID=UPI0037C145DA